MLFAYPAIVHVDTDGLWAEFPDLKSCYTEADDLEELMYNLEEAIECFLWDDVEQGKQLPHASNIKDIKTPKNCFVTLVHGNTNFVKNKDSVRTTLTIPAWLNEKALAKDIDFSKVFQEALEAKLATV